MGPATTQLNITADTGITAADFTIVGGINANGHTTNLNGPGTGEINGVITNVFSPGGLNMSGTGTWILSGANNWRSAHQCEFKNLQVGKNGVGQTGTMLTTVAAAGTLSGTGFIVGSATVNGTISPGDSAGGGLGKLNFNSGLTATPGTATNTALLSINNNHAGDNINVTGALTLNANSNFVVSFAPGYTLLSGESWDLMDWTGLLTLSGFSTGDNFRTGPAGNQGNLILPDLTLLPGYSNQTWQISSLNDGTAGGSLIITVTPEPGRNLLCLFGLLAMAWRRRGSRNESV